MLLHVVLQAAASDPVPSDNNVKAGWVGALVFVLLIAAVTILLRSFTKQLKKVNAADKAGVYGDSASSRPDATGQNAVTQPTDGGVPPTTVEHDR